MLKKIINKNKTEEITSIKSNEELKNDIAIDLKIITAEIPVIRNRITHYSSLNDKEVQTLLSDISNKICIIKNHINFAINLGLEDCLKKAKDLLENLEDIQVNINERIVGNIY